MVNLYIRSTIRKINSLFRKVLGFRIDLNNEKHYGVLVFIIIIAAYLAVVKNKLP